jgi:hypothetical protein
MKMILAVKAHKAKCLKILTLSRQSLEEESDKLLDTLSKISLDFASAEVVVNTTSPVQPCTPSPIDQGRTGQHIFLASPFSCTNHHIREFSYLPFTICPDDFIYQKKYTRRMQACDAPSFSLGPEFETTVTGGPTPSPASPISPIGPSPPRKTIRMSNPKSPLSSTKIKSGEFLFNKRSSQKINLNEDASELEFTQSPIAKKTVREGRIICPPRDCSVTMCLKKREAANTFYKWAMGSKGDPNR